MNKDNLHTVFISQFLIYILVHGELVMDREVWHAAIHGVAESDMPERLIGSDLKTKILNYFFSFMCISTSSSNGVVTLTRI